MAKVLAFKGKPLRTANDLQRALLALSTDLDSGAVTAATARPLQNKIATVMKRLRTQMKSGKPENRDAIKLFFGIKDC